MKLLLNWKILLFILPIILVGCATDRPQVIVITSTFSPQSQLSTPISNQTEVPISIPPTAIPISTQSEFVEASFDNEYIIQPGDTLSVIAQNANVSLQLLLSVNNIANPDLLEVGQVIILPAPPSTYSSNSLIMSDARLVRTKLGSEFDILAFLASQSGFIRQATDNVKTRLDDGSELEAILTADRVIARVSLEYSVDPRILLAILDYRANWLTNSTISDNLQSHPIISAEQSLGFDRRGLYKQLSWLANEVNRGYYNWKYGDNRILEFSDGTRIFYESSLNAGTASLQYVLSIGNTVDQWKFDISDGGFLTTYQKYFGDPFVDDFTIIPELLLQPTLNLPFKQGDIWRFTGGFHGGWGSGSGWAALDFAPPDDRQDGDPFCYVSEYPITAVASGIISRTNNGALVLDLDNDGNEATGWSILYLHMQVSPAIAVGQVVQAGDTLGNASCHGGFSTATHLHIARRYNGEWIPADCINCVNSPPPFVMSNWEAVGLQYQEYQGYMINEAENKQAVAEQGRNTQINEISW